MEDLAEIHEAVFLPYFNHHIRFLFFTAKPLQQ